MPAGLAISPERLPGGPRYDEQAQPTTVSVAPKKEKEHDDDSIGRDQVTVLTKSVPVPGFTGWRELPIKRLYRYMPVDACYRMVERGEVRVSSSSKMYPRTEDPSETRQDDEQSKAVTAVVSKYLGTKPVPKGFSMDVTEVQKTDGGTRMRFRSGVDDSYWYLALSTDLSLNLFEEFDEEASVEIHDPEEFMARLQTATDQLLVPYSGDRFFHGPVDYGDDYVAYGRAVIRLNPCLHKPSRFAPQREYRVVWHPRRTASDHEYLRVSTLRDIARVIRKEAVMSGTEAEVRFPEDAVAEFQSNHNRRGR